MYETDVAWSAGLLEGEGCFTVFRRTSAKWDHKTSAIHCEMTDEDTIRRLHSIFKVGNVIFRDGRVPRNDRAQRKPTWIWSVNNHEGIALVLESVLPYLEQRRAAKAHEILEYIYSHASKGRLGYRRNRSENRLDGESFKPECET